MLRDARRCQVIQEFSFIESLSLSRAKNAHPQSSLDKLNTDQAFSFQQSRIANQDKRPAIKTDKKTQKQAIAIVTNADTATTIDSNWYQPTTDYSLSLAEIIHATSYPQADSKSNLTSTARRGYLGKIVFALACSYGLFVSWWLFGHQGSNLLTALTGGKNIVLSKSEVHFIDYMERSLKEIERQVATEQKASQEVVYVPVYTPTTPNIPSNNLPLASLPSSSIPDLPPPQLAPVEPLGIPAPPPLPEPTPIIDNFNNYSNSTATNQTAIANKPSISHTLVGVLELNSGSAALVKVNGQTRRVWAGETINSDGWILESISNQQANISYQGQVRAISVGETF
jgi:hypothetical protein